MEMPHRKLGVCFRVWTRISGKYFVNIGIINEKWNYKRRGHLEKRNLEGNTLRERSQHLTGCWIGCRWKKRGSRSGKQMGKREESVIPKHWGVKRASRSRNTPGMRMYSNAKEEKGWETVLTKMFNKGSPLLVRQQLWGRRPPCASMKNEEEQGRQKDSCR